MNKDIIGMIDKTTIFKPSFINSLQGRMYRFMEKFPKGQKFRIIIDPVEKPKPVEQTEEFVITEKSTLIEIAEHNPAMFERLMYAAFGPGWKDYFLWKAEAIKEAEEHDSESVEGNS